MFWGCRASDKFVNENENFDVQFQLLVVTVWLYITFNGKRRANDQLTVSVDSCKFSCKSKMNVTVQVCYASESLSFCVWECQ